VTSCAGFGGSSGKDMGLMATVWPDSLFPTKLAPAIAALAARTPFFKNARRFSAWLIAFILFSLSFILVQSRTNVGFEEMAAVHSTVFFPNHGVCVDGRLAIFHRDIPDKREELHLLVKTH